MTITPANTKPGKLRIRASVVCVHRSQLLCVRMRDPRTRVARLFVPGGAIEPGETAADAAAREAYEETGYRVAVDAASEHAVHYPYEWDGELRQIVTHFFRASLVEPGRDPVAVNDANYNEGVVWLALRDIPEQLSFNETIRSAIERLL
jgi:8-oxo-dGTP pyrophosphatase MutT (NUDIX family)